MAGEYTVGHEGVDVGVEGKRGVEALPERQGGRACALGASGGAEVDAALASDAALPAEEHIDGEPEGFGGDPSAGSGGSWARCHRMRLGYVRTHCRIGMNGITRSTTWAARSLVRRAVHEGQIEQLLQENAARISWWHRAQRTRAKPFSKSPHSM